MPTGSSLEREIGSPLTIDPISRSVAKVDSPEKGEGLRDAFGRVMLV
jgi:hypothetical protein